MTVNTFNQAEAIARAREAIYQANKAHKPKNTSYFTVEDGKNAATGCIPCPTCGNSANITDFHQHYDKDRNCFTHKVYYMCWRGGHQGHTFCDKPQGTRDYSFATVEKVVKF